MFRKDTGCAGTSRKTQREPEYNKNSQKAGADRGRSV